MSLPKCPTCATELTQLYVDGTCIAWSKIQECRSCEYPDNRWLVVKQLSSPVRLADQSEPVRSIIDI